MGRRDPDPRPPIEIVGAAPIAESVQVVSTGPRRPGRSTARALAVATGVALLVLIGLSLGRDDDSRGEAADPGSPDTSESADRTTTSRPRTTTTRRTTTTTTIPVGPVFGDASGAGLLAFGPAGWQVVDLDTGARAELVLPSESPHEAIAVNGGVVVSATGGSREAQLYGIGPGGEVSGPVPLGVADQVLSAGRPDRVWLVDGGGRVNEGGGLVNATADVRLVDLRGEVLRSFHVAARYVARGLVDGVVIERGGRIFLANEAGVRPVAVGWTIGAAGDDLLVLTCDDDATCGVDRQPVDGGRANRLVDAVDVDNMGYESSTAADGRFVLTANDYRDGSQSLLLFTPDGRRQALLVDRSSGYAAPPRWLPRDLGLVSTVGNQVHWIRPRDGEWISEEVPGLSTLPAEVVFVIEW